MNRTKHVHYFPLLWTLALTILVFRNVFIHFFTGLPDWNDYPYIVWTLDQVSSNIFSLGSDWTTSNAFYPLKGTLFFSDLLVPQALLYRAFTAFFLQPIPSFNALFLFNLFLNAVSAWILTRVLTKSVMLQTIGTTVFSLSPFLFLNANHFQMLFLSPVFLFFSLLFAPKTRFRGLFLGGVLGLLFWGSVYLAVFLLTAYGLWIVVCLVYQQNKWKQIRREALLSLALFAIIALPAALTYVRVKQQYAIERSHWEYVQYSAHFTDYLFTHRYNSVFSRLPPVSKLNSFNHHWGEAAGALGIVLTLGMVAGLFVYQKREKTPSLSIHLTQETVFWVVLVLIGFIFSLGPRLNANGTLLGIPLPYYVVEKLVPLFDPIRVTSRWSIFVYLGAAWFLLRALAKLQTKKLRVVVTVLAMGGYMFEILPLTFRMEEKQYQVAAYAPIISLCTKKPLVLLEFPLSVWKEEIHTEESLSYDSTMLLSSIDHECNMVNGYSGFDPQEYLDFEHALTDAVVNRQKEQFFSLLSDRSIGIIKLNKSAMDTVYVPVVQGWLLEQTQAVYSDDAYYVGKLQ